jgi:uncharacterized protein
VERRVTDPTGHLDGDDRPGQALLPSGAVCDELDRHQCLDLLRTQAIGRLAVADHGHYPPHIVPVNFVLDGDTVVFRSDPGLKFRLSVLAEHSVSFEVDSIDGDGRMGWSVVVQGRAELLAPGDVAALTAGSSLHPWAPGEKRGWVRITPYAITGRRVRNPPSGAR